LCDERNKQAIDDKTCGRTVDNNQPTHCTSQAPGVSLQLTAVFPMLSTKFFDVSKTDVSVCSVRITSTSFIICTGLKKCIPTCDTSMNLRFPSSTIKHPQIYLDVLTQLPWL
jgi:hypothetical protein